MQKINALSKTLKVLTLLGLWASGAAVAAVQLGQATVLSQQGQRLKVAVPYGTTPGERVPVLRFSIVDSAVPAGFKEVSPKSFTVSQGENKNVVVFQSREIFSAPSVKLSVRVANQDEIAQIYDLTVPANQLATTEAQAAPKKSMGKRSYKGKRTTYKRKIIPQDNLPPK
jgi:hypothetical protein